MFQAYYELGIAFAAIGVFIGLVLALVNFAGAEVEKDEAKIPFIIVGIAIIWPLALAVGLCYCLLYLPGRGIIRAFRYAFTE